MGAAAGDMSRVADAAGPRLGMNRIDTDDDCRPLQRHGMIRESRRAQRAP
jgi:hypothetical protein